MVQIDELIINITVKEYTALFNKFDDNDFFLDVLIDNDSYVADEIVKYFNVSDSDNEWMIENFRHCLGAIVIDKQSIIRERIINVLICNLHDVL
ncbi:hypothetical protein [uncultured Mediterranean phage uvMED]|nr:hypothetical protein [uncultured Mediterranean phage uvMED]